MLAQHITLAVTRSLSLAPENIEARIEFCSGARRVVFGARAWG